MRIITLILALCLTFSVGFAQKPEETSQPNHWAFRVPVRPEIPTLVDPSSRNPIDALIRAEQQKHGITPLGRAEKSIALRRLYLDLIGLPPTRDELKAYLADDRPDAWERVVDRLLASPRYAERWGRHWMDIWRYTDWYGLGAQLRYSQKHIWHWRDWIIESLNEDKGYDRMILEMLAGDEIAPTDPEVLRATGFLARNYFLFNRTTWLDDTIEHTSKAFLGLTMNCVKCHAHKYDPFTHEDYYRFRAFFEPHQVRLDTVPSQLDLEKDGIPRVFDAHPDAPTYLHIRGNAKDPDTSKVIKPGVPESLGFPLGEISAIRLPAEAHSPGLRDFVLRDQLAAARRELENAQIAMNDAQARLARFEGNPQLNRAKGELFLADEFDEFHDGLWEQGSGKWSYDAGHLVQKATGATRYYVRSRQEHPRDFEATLKFRTLGGDRWKSVGLAFDAVDGRDKLVYLSAVQPGSKLQLAIRGTNGDQYPSDAQQARGVTLNQWYELKVVIRDQLLNVSVNGEHALAYRLPVPREAGRLAVVAFDAVVEFDSITVRSLPSEVTLIEPGKSPPSSLEHAEAQLRVAQKRLEAAKLHPNLLQSAHRADEAKFQQPPPENLKELIAAAALAARRYELAQAELAIAEAQLKTLSKDEKAKQQAQKELKTARDELAQSQKALESPGENYPSLRASLKALEGPDETDQSRRAAYPTESTGRRTALAKWIIDRKNPLTARVAVNHIWTRHFGQPLVDPVTDFGFQTDAPPLQSVLDWLAVELIESDWSMKQIHRLIVTSEVYRRSSISANADEATRQADPQNHYYWRRRVTRTEAEVIRDSLLHLAGALEDRFGGPTVDPKNQSAQCRSLYFTHSRDDQNLFLSMFDDADILRCYRRSESVVPQQALALANSKLSLEMARQLSAQLTKKLSAQSTTDRETFVTAAFETVLCRKPTEEEVSECLRMMTEMVELLNDRADREQRARAALIHALLNHNDFVTIR